MNQSSSMWSPDERKRDGRATPGSYSATSGSRERHLSGASNNSVSSRQCSGYNDYGRGYDNQGGRRSRGTSGRITDADMVRMQQMNMGYDSHTQQPESHSVPSDNMLHSFPQRRIGEILRHRERAREHARHNASEEGADGITLQTMLKSERHWSGSNVSLPSAHRSNSATHRYHENRKRESEPPTPRKPLDVGSKLEEKDVEAGPQIYMAAGTAPPSSFRQSPAPSKTSSPVSTFAGPVPVARSLVFSNGPSAIDQASYEIIGGNDHVANLSAQYVHSDMRGGLGSVRHKDKDNNNSGFSKRERGGKMANSRLPHSHSSSAFFVHTNPDQERLCVSQITGMAAFQQSCATGGTKPRMLSDLELQHHASVALAPSELENIVLPVDESERKVSGEKQKKHLEASSAVALGAATALVLPSTTSSVPVVLPHSMPAVASVTYQPPLLQPSLVNRGRRSQEEEYKLLVDYLQKCRSAGDVTPPEEVMPILMRCLQSNGMMAQMATASSMAPTGTCASDVTARVGLSAAVDEQLQQQQQLHQLQQQQHHMGQWHTLMAAHMSMANSQQSIAMAIPMAGGRSPQSNQNPQQHQPHHRNGAHQKQNYSSVVARSSSSLSQRSNDSSSSSRKGASMSHQNHQMNNRMEQHGGHSKAGTMAPTPLSAINAKTPRRDDRAPVLLPLIDRSKKEHDEDKGARNGESGYHSESSPPLNTADNSQYQKNGGAFAAAAGSGIATTSTKSIDTPTSQSTTGPSSSAAPPVVSAWSTRSPLSVAKAKSQASYKSSSTITSSASVGSTATTTTSSPSASHSAQTTTAVAAAAGTGASVKKAPSPSAPSPPPTSPLDNQGHFEVSKMDVLSEEIWHYHNSVTQTESMLSRKLHLRDRLYYSICPVFPMCGLYVVGSSLNGFGNNSSDMDLCLMITNKDLDQKTDAVVVLNMILSTLSGLECVAQQKLILAKVPILRIKFAAPYDDITVDLNANNSVAIKNTHLLCYYSLFDWRVRPLVSVVKEWAKRKGINDANRSSFTSYSLVLMVIHYLQCGSEHPVLPSLQTMFPKRFATKCDVRTLSVTTPLPATPDDWRYSDKATLGELLIGFLDYYANKFDYNRDAISVRQGKRVDRAVMARTRPHGQSNNGPWRSQWRCICIEEPFTLSNTAHSIYDEMVFEAIKTSLQEAHLELEKTRDLKCLLDCKPITVNAPVGGAVVYAASYEGTSRNMVLSLDSSISPPLPMTSCGSSSSAVARGPSVSTTTTEGAMRGMASQQSSNGLGAVASMTVAATSIATNSTNSTASSSASSCSSSSNGDEHDTSERLLDIRCSVLSQLERGVVIPPSSQHQQLPRSSGGRRRSQRRQNNNNSGGGHTAVAAAAARI